MSTKQIIRRAHVTLGCDPEFFFEKDGKILGSEKVINAVEDSGTGTVIQDGVQVELNPRPDTCRQLLGRNLAWCFKKVGDTIKKDPTIKINLSPMVKVTKSRLKELSDKSKVFGCMPSKKVGDAENKVVIVPKTYQYRSAGGHIHLGTPFSLKGSDKTERLVNILDIIVGNTCVLLDRDEGNIARRKIYGKAGEYRQPTYGIEYRTLSNFWLRSYPLMSFATGMSRFAVSILDCSVNTQNYFAEKYGENYNVNFEAELMSLVNMDDIRRAINENDFELAKSNFEKIKPFIRQYSSQDHPLHDGNLDLFDYFVDQGIEKFFKEEPLNYWITRAGNIETLGHGWESFIEIDVKKHMNTKKK